MVNKNMFVSIIIIILLISNKIIYSLNNAYFEKKEHELLNENFIVISQVTDFDFYGCVKDILYILGNHVLKCSDHTHAHHVQDVDATLLVKSIRSNKFSHNYYYLCVDHNFCYAARLVKLKK